MVFVRAWARALERENNTITVGWPKGHDLGANRMQDGQCAHVRLRTSYMYRQKEKALAKGASFTCIVFITVDARAQTQTQTLACTHLDHGSDRRLEVVAFGLGRIEDLDRVQPAGDLHQWRRVEVGLELARIESGRHNDELEVGALLGNLP